MFADALGFVLGGGRNSALLFDMHCFCLGYVDYHIGVFTRPFGDARDPFGGRFRAFVEQSSVIRVAECCDHSIPQ